MGAALSRELALEAYRASQAHSTHVAAAQSLGLVETTYKSRLSRAKEMARQGLLGTDAVLPGFEISRISEGPRGTTVEQRPERSGGFNIPEGHAIKGVSAFLDADGRVIGQWVKTKEGERDPVYVADIIRKAFEGFTASAIEQATPSTDEDTATIWPLADLHLGLLAWEKESGENYDLKIAEKTVKDTMRRLFDAAPPSKTGVILGLGDLLHFDGYEPMTSRSKNVLDVDGRYPLVLQTATSLLIWAVEQALAKHEIVIVRILPGNHDDQSAIAVSLALAMYYRDSERVKIDTDPSRFWWWRFGTTFLGATHGDMTKPAELPLIMATSKPEDWGASTHRMIMCGHIHHKTALKEYGNVTVESFRSPAARDAYHSGHGYVSGRSMSAITIHKQFGEISRQTANIIAA